MEIKTLADIVAELDDKQPPTPSTKQLPKQSKRKKTLVNDRLDIVKTNTPATKHTAPINTTKYTSHGANNKHQSQPKPPKRSKTTKRFHPASPYTPKLKPDTNKKSKSLSPSDIDTIKQAASTVHKGDKVNESSTIDNLTDQLKSTLKTDEERLAEKEALKADSRLRWLAFYYLSRREHSASELKDKLIAKAQDPDKIDALLNEFKDKGYQSDYRTAMMLIREGIRKRRGRVRIKQSFYERKVSLPSNIDELIDMAMDESDAFADFVSDNPLVDGVDWLKLAVEARVKKYGDALPDTPKDKARQLRFLQYRGFNTDVCFDALKHNIDSLENRF